MTDILKAENFTKNDEAGIVLAGGCFDILHKGHIEFLTSAKKCGSKLIILLESDENIQKMKGIGRPVNKQIERAKNLSDLNLVDIIILLNNPSSDDYYYNLVKLIQPDIIALTDDDPLLRIKEEQAKMAGGKIKVVMNRNKNYSTSKLIKLK